MKKESKSKDKSRIILANNHHWRIKIKSTSISEIPISIAFHKKFCLLVKEKDVHEIDQWVK